MARRSPMPLVAAASEPRLFMPASEAAVAPQATSRTHPEDVRIRVSVSAAAKPPRPAGRRVELFNDHVFGELRAQAQVPDDFINAGWDFEKLAAAGGKGGALMARVGAAFIVKELSLGDHRALLALAQSYAQHVQSGDSLLCPIYMHFQDDLTGRTFFAMRNGIGHGPFTSLWDLKGCADDKLLERDGKAVPAVHKRIWNVGMWVSKSSWTAERKRYYEGKLAAKSVDIAMTEDQRAKCLNALRRDTAWLAANNLMDYSLLVATKEATATAADAGHRPWLRRAADGADVVLNLVIIDFLQTWTTGKKVAQVIKCMEHCNATVPPQAYADRFASHFARRIRVADARCRRHE